MQNTRLTSQPAEQTPDPSMRVILEKTAHELQNTSQRCTALQWSMSALLENAHHPDIATELHLLQDIDRIQQELKDISALLLSIAPTTSTITPIVEHLAGSIKLDSLRARLLPATSGEAPCTDMPSDPNDVDITWF